MQVLKIGDMAFPTQTGIAFRSLDLDHVGTPVGELPYAGRPGAHPRQIDDLEPGERTCRPLGVAHEASIADNLATRRRKSGSSENRAERYASIRSLASHNPTICAPRHITLTSSCSTA